MDAPAFPELFRSFARIGLPGFSGPAAQISVMHDALVVLRGGLLAGLLFVLPGALVILVPGLGYALYGGVPLAQAVFPGVKAAVVGVVLNLSVWFALHVVFSQMRAGALLPVPVRSSVAWLGAGLTALAILLLFSGHSLRWGEFWRCWRGLRGPGIL